MIVFVTGMTTIPKNCYECDMNQCSLPVSSRDYTRIRKPYLTKRHHNCPLREITDGQAPVRNCLSCSNSFSERGNGGSDVLHCMERDGEVVDESGSCESWN